MPAKKKQDITIRTAELASLGGAATAEQVQQMRHLIGIMAARTRVVELEAEIAELDEKREALVAECTAQAAVASPSDEVWKR